MNAPLPAALLAAALGAGALLIAQTAQAADPSVAHPHTGVLPRVTGAPAAQVLSAAEEATLLSGAPVYRQIKYATGDGGQGVAVFDVHADADAVWKTILDFGAYPRMVDKVEKCEVYRRQNDQIFVRFVLETLDIEYFIEHRYRPAEGYMSWTLDYARQSDLDDSVGYWLVRPAPGHPGYTRVEYSVGLRVSGWVPSWIQDMVARTGLEQATTWLKVNSEARG